MYTTDELLLYVTELDPLIVDIVPLFVVRRLRRRRRAALVHLTALGFMYRRAHGIACVRLV